jgi:predicted phosphoribosyltransferase
VAACRWPSRWQQSLNAPLDVFVVRKLGVPGMTNLRWERSRPGAFGFFNNEVVEYLAVV